MVAFVIFAFITCINTISASLTVRKNFGVVAPFACMAEILLMYVLMCISSNAFISALIVTLISCLYFLFLIIKNKKSFFEKFIKHCKNGFIFFWICALICAFIAYLHGDNPCIYDEYSHWGKMVKEIVRTNYFYIGDNTVLAWNNAYPPIIPLLESFGCVLINKFNITNCYSSLWLFQILILFVVIPESTNNRKWNKLRIILLYTIILSSTIICSTAIDNSNWCFWYTMYIDTALGLLFGLGLYLSILKNKKLFHWSCFVILISFMSLIKQVGIIFNMILLAIAFVELIIEFKKGEGTNKFLSSVVRPLVICCLFVFIFYGSWLLIYKINPSERYAPSFSASINEIVRYFYFFLNGPSTDRESFVLSNFFSNLWNGAYLNNGHFTIFICVWFFISLITSIVFVCYSKKRKVASFVNCRFVLLPFIVIVVPFLYIFFLLFFYLYVLYPSNTLISFNRYINTLFTSFFILFFIILIKYMQNLNVKYLVSMQAIVLAIIIALFPGFENLFIVNNEYVLNNIVQKMQPDSICTDKWYKYYNNNTESKQKWDAISDKIESRSNILVLNQIGVLNPDSTFNAWCFSYFVDDSMAESFNSNHIQYTFGQINSRNFMFNKYDYVYTICTSDEYINDFYETFNIKIEKNKLYKTNKDSYSLEEIPINTDFLEQ